MYIDTHCHLSLEDYDDIDLVVKENREAGIDKIIISGYSRDTIKESLEIIDKSKATKIELSNCKNPSGIFISVTS